jgi:hypothetical protein
MFHNIRSTKGRAVQSKTAAALDRFGEREAAPIELNH